jgi:NAD(P)-dependent dehydrogenase (short-subunit alcohol dehydrogenase family)
LIGRKIDILLPSKWPLFTLLPGPCWKASHQQAIPAAKKGYEGNIDMRLANKIAMITGAGAGMGEATALLFAREGARVAVLDIDAANARRVADQIIAEGGQAIAVAGDISKTGDVKNMVARTVAELGLPNVLHNNAGIQTEGKRPLFDVTEEAFDRCIEVNLKAPWLMMKYVVPHMIEAGGGSIINTASIGAFLAVGSVGYCASKGGLVSMTRVAAVELGRYNIRVNALCPGITETPMAVKTRADLAARGVTGAPKFSALNGRMAKPEEMAYMALFLASDESSYATGVPFINDGGWTSMSGLDLNPS